MWESGVLLLRACSIGLLSGRYPILPCPILSDLHKHRQRLRFGRQIFQGSPAVFLQRGSHPRTPLIPFIRPYMPTAPVSQLLTDFTKAGPMSLTLSTEGPFLFPHQDQDPSVSNRRFHVAAAAFWEVPR